MEPQRLIGQPVCTDDHRGRYVGRLEDPAPLRYHLTVTGEHDRLGRIRRDVHRDLPTIVVLEPLRDELSRDGPRRSLPLSSGADANGKPTYPAPESSTSYPSARARAQASSANTGAADDPPVAAAAGACACCPSAPTSLSAPTPGRSRVPAA